MAIKHREIVGSKDGTDANDRSSETSLVYLLTGSNVVDDMRGYIESNNLAPDEVDGLVYRSLHRERIANNVWRWEVKYIEADLAQIQDKLEPGEEATFSFDTTGGTTLILATASTDVQKFGALGLTLIEHHGAINVRDNGGQKDVQGTNIIIPALKLVFRKRIPKATITMPWVKTLAALTGTVNNALFKEFDAGELLFAGATGEQGTKTDPEVQFHFIASQNVTGLTIGQIAGIAKKGHEYLWVQFEAAEDAAAHGMAARPQTVYVHKVYKEASWAALSL